ncbi:GNAT family N-acetyltransferase [Roseateles sp. P5_E7]
MSCADQAPPSPSAIAEVAKAWVDGWVLSRQTPAATDHGSHLTILVGAPGHSVRHVFTAFSAETVQRLAHGPCADGTWLKVMAPQHAVKPLLPSHWQVHEHEYLMHTPLGGAMPTSHAPRVDLERRGDVVTATLLGADGAVAARAKAAVIGTAAVFDQVVTEPQHRRKGYGALLMSRLAAECRARGATRGILVAIDAGRLLYSALGWAVVAEVTAASWAAP